MRRLLVVVTALSTGGCHRLTGRPGDAGVFRHYHGWIMAAKVSAWLGLAAVACGLGFFVYHALDHDFDKGRLGWAAVLVIIGLTVAMGSYATLIELWSTSS